MRKRAEPRQLGKLVEVQRARHAIAEMALMDARRLEGEARTIERAAAAEASVAQKDWFDLIHNTGFSPDYARALATRVVAREAAAKEAGERRATAETQHLEYQAGWRRSEALVEQTETSLAQSRRDWAKKREERRLNELSDRMTYRWILS